MLRNSMLPMLFTRAAVVILLVLAGGCVGKKESDSLRKERDLQYAQTLKDFRQIFDSYKYTGNPTDAAVRKKRLQTVLFLEDLKNSRLQSPYVYSAGVYKVVGENTLTIFYFSMHNSIPSFTILGRGGVIGRFKGVDHYAKPLGNYPDTWTRACTFNINLLKLGGVDNSDEAMDTELHDGPNEPDFSIDVNAYSLQEIDGVAIACGDGGKREFVPVWMGRDVANKVDPNIPVEPELDWDDVWGDYIDE